VSTIDFFGLIFSIYKASLQRSQIRNAEATSTSQSERSGIKQTIKEKEKQGGKRSNQEVYQ